MGFGDPQKAEPIVLIKPEETPKPAPPGGPVMLMSVPDEVDLGTVQVGQEVMRDITTVAAWRGSGALVTTLARPSSNRSEPSAFRDQLGLDPQPLFDDQAAREFTLASPMTVPLRDLEQSSVLRIRFKPLRAGQRSTIATLKFIGSDGSIDTKQIRVNAIAKPQPRTVDVVQLPDPAKGLEPQESAGVHEFATLEGASNGARAEANFLADKHANGAKLAEREILSYHKAAEPPENWSWLLELAIGMGVAGIAGFVARFVARGFASRIAQRNKPSTGAISGDAGKDVELKPSDQIQTLIADALKEGFKGTAKKVLHPKAPAGPRGPKPGSSNEQIGFFTEQDDMIAEFRHSYELVVNMLQEQLMTDDAPGAAAAMNLVAQGFNAAAATAKEVQARVIETQWISATARQTLGEREHQFPSGKHITTTRAEGALDFGERGAMGVEMGAVPRIDGVLDVHVEIPRDNPAETSRLKVQSASLTGISQEVADRIHDGDLGSLGIPIRMIVRNQPALITRDEIGTVRVMGFLKTEAGTQWSSPLVHVAAKLLMNQLVSKTLAQWGVAEIKTNDATGRHAVGAKP